MKKFLAKCVKAIGEAVEVDTLIKNAFGERALYITEDIQKLWTELEFEPVLFLGRVFLIDPCQCADIRYQDFTNILDLNKKLKQTKSLGRR
jgi:hypothetical protein